MEQNEYKNGEQVVYKAKGQLIIAKKEPQEVDISITESYLVIDAEESIKIPIANIKDTRIDMSTHWMVTQEDQQKPRTEKITLTFIDESRKKSKVTLEVASVVGHEIQSKIRVQQGRQEAQFFKYATFWNRLVAYIIDAIILGIISGILSAIGGIGDMAGWWSIMWTWIGVLIAAMYFIIPYSTDGQTLGKHFLGIKVMSLDGSPLNWRKGIVRYFGYIISALILFLGFLWIVGDKHKQAWHDKMAGTSVVRDWVTVEQIRDAVEQEGLEKSHRYWLIALGIPTVLVCVAMGVGIGYLYQQMPSVAPQEIPAVTAWKQEGIVEEVTFTTWTLSSNEIGKCHACEINAVIPSAVFDDDSKSIQLAHRLSGDLTYSEEIDIIIVRLIKEEKIGFLTTTSYKYWGYSIMGKGHLFDQAFEAYQRAAGTRPPL